MAFGTFHAAPRQKNSPYTNGMRVEKQCSFKLLTRGEEKENKREELLAVGLLLHAPLSSIPPLGLLAAAIRSAQSNRNEYYFRDFAERLKNETCTTAVSVFARPLPFDVVIPRSAGHVQYSGSYRDLRVIPRSTIVY